LGAEREPISGADLVPTVAAATIPRVTPGRLGLSRFTGGHGPDFPGTPGPGYTLSHSHDEVRFKYEDLPKRMRPTLAALGQAPVFADTVAVLRERGWLDWHILLAIHCVAKNARLHFRSPPSPDDLEVARELFLAPEPEGDPVPLRFFAVSALEQALDVTLAASAISM